MGIWKLGNVFLSWHLTIVGVEGDCTDISNPLKDYRMDNREQNITSPTHTTHDYIRQSGFFIFHYALNLIVIQV